MPSQPVKTFEDIVAGRAPCHEVWSDERHLAFLNASPIRPGHVILVPKRVSSYVFDMPEAEYRALWDAARRVAAMMRERLECERVCVAVVGWEVRHVHVHLVPTDRAGEFPALPGRAASADELTAMQARLRG
jgi:histidine triad (HIT) family protein